MDAEAAADSANDSWIGVQRVKTGSTVFLDFDGCLNHRKHVATGGYPKMPFAPECIERLNRLIASTDAKIVISSTWRFGKTIEELQELLASHGAVCHVVGVTPTHVERTLVQAYTRGQGITFYLTDHPTTTYVVLDDDDDMEGHEAHFVRTSMETGLTDANVEEAAAILRRY